MSDRKYLFTLCFGGIDGLEIYNMSSVAMSSLGEVGQYTKEEIVKLRQLLATVPPPVFSKEPFKALHNQALLADYGEKIRSMLNQGETPARSVAPDVT